MQVILCWKLTCKSYPPPHEALHHCTAHFKMLPFVTLGVPNVSNTELGSALIYHDKVIILAIFKLGK